MLFQINSDRNKSLEIQNQHQKSAESSMSSVVDIKLRRRSNLSNNIYSKNYYDRTRNTNDHQIDIQQESPMLISDDAKLNAKIRKDSNEIKSILRKASNDSKYIEPSEQNNAINPEILMNNKLSRDINGKSSLSVMSSSQSPKKISFNIEPFQTPSHIKPRKVHAPYHLRISKDEDDGELDLHKTFGTPMKIRRLKRMHDQQTNAEIAGIPVKRASHRKHFIDRNLSVEYQWGSTINKNYDLPGNYLTPSKASNPIQLNIQENDKSNGGLLNQSYLLSDIGNSTIKAGRKMANINSPLNFISVYKFIENNRSIENMKLRSRRK